MERGETREVRSGFVPIGKYANEIPLERRTEDVQFGLQNQLRGYPPMLVKMFLGESFPGARAHRDRIRPVKL